MENLSRNLAQESAVRNFDRLRKAPKCWTLFLVGHLGEIVSFRLTKPLLVGLTISAVVILGFAVFGVVSYNAIRIENAGLKKMLKAAKTDLETANRAYQAGKSIVGRSEAEKPVVAASSALTAELRGTGAKKVDYPANREGSQAAPVPRSREKVPLLSSERMSVENFKMRRNLIGNALNFEFYLKNVDPEGRRLSGYTFAVLEPAKDSWELFRACPQAPLVDGRPSVFQKGEFFSIARFKVVRGTFPDVGAIDRYGTVTVCVYSKTGDLFVEEVFEVSKVLQL